MRFKRTPAKRHSEARTIARKRAAREALSRRYFVSEEGRDRHNFWAKKYFRFCSKKKAGAIRTDRGGTTGDISNLRQISGWEDRDFKPSRISRTRGKV